MKHPVDSELSALAVSFADKYSEQKRLFELCTEITDQVAEAVKAGRANVGDEIDLPDGRVFVIIDNFAVSNVAWRPAPIRRIDLEAQKKSKK